MSEGWTLWILIVRSVPIEYFTWLWHEYERIEENIICLEGAWSNYVWRVIHCVNESDSA